MDDFEDLPEDIGDIEIIYSDDEDEYNEDLVNGQQLRDDHIETEVIDVSISTFSKHTKSIFTNDVSKDEMLAVTGGEDDVAYVWNIKTGEVVFECTGHKDSVTEVGFNHNDQYVATGDMAGLIQVWSIQEKKLIWCYEGDDMEWLSWHPAANVLICGCQTGDIFVWQIPSGNCKVLPSPTNVSCTCGIVLPNGKQLLAGYDDGQIRLWDIKDSATIWMNIDSSSVNTLDINSDGTLAIVTPGAQLIKMADGKTIASVLIEHESEIESAIFDNDLGVVITGALSGQLCVWQLGRITLRHQAKIEASVTLMKRGSNNKIFIGANDGCVYVCDIKGGTLKEVLTGHKSEILSISVYSNGERILTTSDDGTAKIFEVKS